MGTSRSLDFYARGSPSGGQRNTKKSQGSDKIQRRTVDADRRAPMRNRPERARRMSVRAEGKATKCASCAEVTYELPDSEREFGRRASPQVGRRAPVRDAPLELKD